MDIKHTHQTRPPKTWLILWDEIEESEKSRVNWTQGSQLLSYNHQAPSTSTIQSSISTAHTMWTGGTECFSGQFSMELFHLCAVYSSLASYPGHVVRGLGTRLTPHWMLQWPFSMEIFQIIPLCCLLLNECCSVCTLVRCTSFLWVFLRNGVTLCIAWCEHTLVQIHLGTRWKSYIQTFLFVRSYYPVSF